MVESPLWCRPGTFLIGNPYRQGWATAQTPAEPDVSIVKVQHGLNVQATPLLIAVADGSSSIYLKQPVTVLDQLYYWRAA